MSGTTPKGILMSAYTKSEDAIAKLTPEQFRSAVLTASMAPGINTYIFANMYGVARRVAASAVLIGTALSVVSIWVWLSVIP